MKATIALIVVLSTVASADTYKLGVKESLKHGCATPHGAAVLDDFIHKDPSFTINGGKAILTLSMPTSDHRGVHEKSWAGEAISSTLAHWDMPRNEDAGTQVRLLIDLDPIQWCDNAACTMQTYRIRVSLIQDYDPEHNGKHENVCAESWFGQAVRL